jgi:hypothetical protein
MNHEYFWIEVFGTPHNLALVFVIGREEGSTFLKGEFPGCGNESWWT